MARSDDVRQGAGITPEEPVEMTLDEICRACGVETAFVLELVEEGVLAPEGREPGAWRFTYTHVRRVRVASHLRSDLGVNPAGAALALELLEEIEALRARLETLDR
jgi:chaperone modulatory protein CbpM